MVLLQQQVSAHACREAQHVASEAEDAAREEPRSLPEVLLQLRGVILHGHITPHRGGGRRGEDMVGGGAEARIANERPAGVWQNTEETEEQEVAHTDAEPPLHH